MSGRVRSDQVKVWSVQVLVLSFLVWSGLFWPGLDFWESQRAFDEVLGDLRGLLRRLGAVFGVFWALLGPSWTVLGGSWEALGASWGALGCLLEPLRGPLGASWAPVEAKVEGDLFFGGVWDPPGDPLGTLLEGLRRDF